MIRRLNWAIVPVMLISLFAVSVSRGTGIAFASTMPSHSYVVNQVGNGTARDPSLVFDGGNYMYQTSYGTFTFSGSIPLNYSLTPDQIGSTVLYSAIWMNASTGADEEFPYVGDSSILTANNTFFHSTTNVCKKEQCSQGHIVAVLDVSWHFYSGWVAPKLSINLTQTDKWKDKYGDLHLFWIHSVTDYTEWVVDGQCGAGQIAVEPIASILDQSEVAILTTDLVAKLVDDPNNPHICTRLDWSDYRVTSPILGGQFTNTLLSGKNLVIDFGENVFAVDPTVAVVVATSASVPSVGGSSWWFTSTMTVQSIQTSETPSITTPSFTLPTTLLDPLILQRELENWLHSRTLDVPNMLIVTIIGIALAFMLKKKRQH